MKKALNFFTNKFLRKLDSSPLPTATDVWPLDITEQEMRIIKFSRPFTMTSVDRMLCLCRSLEYIIGQSIPGDFVECGVWKGGSSMIAAQYFMEYNQERAIWLYDSFEGMTRPDSLHDIDYAGVAASNYWNQAIHQKQKWCHAEINEVRSNMNLTGYSTSKIHFVKGNVLDTLPRSGIPECISILRLDTDWYESTLHELKHLYNHVSSGGFVIIDDYGHWNGARKAVNEFFESQNIHPYLHRVDYTCRIIHKP